MPVLISIKLKEGIIDRNRLLSNNKSSLEECVFMFSITVLLFNFLITISAISWIVKLCPVATITAPLKGF